MPGAMRCSPWSGLPARTISMRPTCSRSLRLRSPRTPAKALQNGRKPPNGSIHKPRQPKPLLATEPSAALRDQLIAEIQQLKDATISRYGRTGDCPPRTRSRRTMPVPSRRPIKELLSPDQMAPAARTWQALDATNIPNRASPLPQGRPQAQQGPSRVRRSASLPGLPALALRCPSSQICPAAIARTQGQRRIYRAAVP